MKHRTALARKQYITSVHEAGHGCAAVAFGLRFEKIHIAPKQNGHTLGSIGWGGLDFCWLLLRRKGNEDPRIVNLVQRRIVVSFAGIAAQRRVVAGTTDIWYDGYSDRAAADAWLQRLIAGPPPWNAELVRVLPIHTR